MGMPLSVSGRPVGFIALIGQGIAQRRARALGDSSRSGAPGARSTPPSAPAAAPLCAPVLMTAALAALGLVPAAMSHAIGSEVQRPIAVVIVGGTLSACALTLVVLPVMYGMWARLAERYRCGASCATAPPHEARCSQRAPENTDGHKARPPPSQ
jgi:cobalt-zinc-cadmium resistance protein CzcA